MSSYTYEAVSASGISTRGTIDVASQGEALQRIKEMGLFPTRVAERRLSARAGQARRQLAFAKDVTARLPMLGGRVKPRPLAVFTRQLATLIDAGMPLLRGLRILEQQERRPVLKHVLREIGDSIESGSSLTEALAQHPRIFNPLYLNMVRAGETGGVLEVTLQRLAEFMEKAHKIKSKVKGAMFYPVAVFAVAMAVMGVLMVYVVPRFQEVFNGLMAGNSMPAFTVFVMRISDAVRHHAPTVGMAVLALVILCAAFVRTQHGRLLFDRLKITAPILGPVFLKAAISRFTRTLGTLLGSGVPVLQALSIVKETAGNLVLANVVNTVHDCVKEGETITLPLRESRVIPPLVVGMVDVGEQTGALPDMLLKIADNCDDDVDNAVSAMTSLLEPIMIVFLAVIVGSIVIAMFLPLIVMMNQGFDGGNGKVGDS